MILRKRMVSLPPQNDRKVAPYNLAPCCQCVPAEGGLAIPKRNKRANWFRFIPLT
ncbi:hypothetical protein H5T88_09730 [bacterium]|nr:hypothetical protein [bacterium]